MSKTQKRMNDAVRLAESKGDDGLAFKLRQVGRAISAATQTEINLESWDDFASWWNTNRSEQLIFSITDTLGEQNPAVAHLKDILQKQNELDKQLHSVYMGLKGTAQGGGGESKPEKPEKETTETFEDIEEDIGGEEEEEDVESED